MNIEAIDFLNRLNESGAIDYASYSHLHDLLTSEEPEWVSTVTDQMVAEALDARASMSQLHHYRYSTEKCRCGEEWTDSHWMRFILERALSRAEEPEWEPPRIFPNPDKRDDDGIGLLGGAPRW